MTATSTTECPAIRPEDGLIYLIVSFLAPMFLGVSGGDINFARAAAMQTVRGYQARDHVDLIAIAQIIAYGLAALGSLSLSMADDLSISMTLRLRGNANALNRSAEQNRRMLRDRRPKATPAQAETQDVSASVSPSDDWSEADGPRRHAEIQPQAQRPATANAATPNAATPDAATSAAKHPKTATPPTMMTPQDIQAMWANAMTDVAAEFAADLGNLPPQERRQATMRIQALSTTAHTLMSGAAPHRPQPGDLLAIMQPPPPHRAPKHR